jgi:hypothetical protein
VKQSSYSIATHVAFWTAKSQQDANVRLATIEYLLDFGHALENITAALNDYSAPNPPVLMRAIDKDDCAEMQALLDDLDDSTCLKRQLLCKAVGICRGCRFHDAGVGDYRFSNAVVASVHHYPIQHTAAHEGRRQQHSHAVDVELCDQPHPSRRMQGYRDDSI